MASSFEVNAARIIAEWNDALVMGPGPNPVGGMVGLLDVSDNNGSAASHAPSAALAMLMLGAGGLYVVKMRKGA